MTSRTERILIVDADEAASTELSRYLEARGFYVSSCPDMSRVKSRFSDGFPDVVFADLAPDAVRELAGMLEEADTYTPIVVCSETRSSEDVVRHCGPGLRILCSSPLPPINQPWTP